MPAKEVLEDYLSEASVEDDEKAECIDTFILNVTFLGLLRTIGGAERLIPLEQALEEGPKIPQPARAKSVDAGPTVSVQPVANTGSTRTMSSLLSAFILRPLERRCLNSESTPTL